jgi:hypothetical protein
MRRVMTFFLPLLFALWLSAAVAELVASGDGAGAQVAFWLSLPVAWFLMVPVAGFIGGVVGFEPRNMRNLYGMGWVHGMRMTRRTGRWHHT